MQTLLPTLHPSRNLLNHFRVHPQRPQPRTHGLKRPLPTFCPTFFSTFCSAFFQAICPTGGLAFEPGRIDNVIVIPFCHTLFIVLVKLFPATSSITAGSTPNARNLARTASSAFSRPSSRPSALPSSRPSARPSALPSARPAALPSSRPFARPAASPLSQAVLTMSS